MVAQDHSKLSHAHRDEAGAQAHSARPSLNRLALTATAHCLSGCATGEVLGLAIGTALGWATGPTIALAVVLAFLFGYAFTMILLLRAGLAFDAVLKLALDRTDEALAEARDLAKLAPDNLPALAVLGLCLGRAGHADEARALLERLDGAPDKPFISSLELARIAAGLRDSALTIRYLERAVDAREGFLPFIGGDDEFAFLHRDSRYLTITRKIGIGAARGAAPRG